MKQGGFKEALEKKKLNKLGTIQQSIRPISADSFVNNSYKDIETLESSLDNDFVECVDKLKLNLIKNDSIISEKSNDNQQQISKNLQQTINNFEESSSDLNLYLGNKHKNIDI